MSLDLLRRGVAMAGLAVLLGATAGAAPALGQDAAELPDQVVIFVIDLSGSMNEPFDGDRTKLDIAKEAFAAAFEDVSPSALVGLRVYGDQLPARGAANREQNCTEDTRLVVPVAQVDRELLIQEVAGFTATGDTPIGLALRAADNDIPAGALGTVVLFSDGRDECFDADLDGDPAVGPSWGEDPCEVAKEIAGEGVDLRIDRIETVGFGADAEAETQLRCIAESTGGTYTAIATADDARAILPELLAQLGSPRIAVRLGGRPIQGTPAASGAPDLDRLDQTGHDGRYTDTIDMNSERWYRMREFGPGGGTLTATVFGLPAREGIRLGLRAELPETEQIFFEGRADDNAGVPRAPSASVRCPGCSISGGPNEVFWVVSLTTDEPGIEGTFDLELLTEDVAFGGLPTICQEPQECWYEAVINVRLTELAEKEAELEEAAAGTELEGLLAERNDLADEVAMLEVAVEEARAATEEEQGVDPPDPEPVEAAPAPAEESTSWTIPIVLVALAAITGAGAMLVARSRPASTVAGVSSETRVSERPGVVGQVEYAEEVVTTPEEAVDDVREDPSRTEPPPAPSPAEEAIEQERDFAEEGAREVGDEEVAETFDETMPVGEEEAPETAGEMSEPTPEESGASPAMSPAGWYDDPHGANQLRWWDGRRWTDETHAKDGST